MKFLSRLLDQVSEFLAHRKGLLPLVGVLLILLNLLLQFILPGSWLATTNLSLHIGLVIALFGLMLAWAL
ncbi:MAG: hypothetical protein AB1846_08910 [Chloroflexota bacterium]